MAALTSMRVVVDTAENARTAIEGGADLILLRLGRTGEQSDRAVLHDVGEAVRGHCPLSVSVAADELQKPWPDWNGEGGFDELWIPFDGTPSPLNTGLHDSVRRIAMLTAEADPRVLDLALLHGFSGISIGEATRPQRLLQLMPVAALQRQVQSGRARGLRVSVAGHMEAPDIPRLLAIAPDDLVLDRIIRRDGRTTGPLHLERIRFVRDLIPRTTPDKLGATVRTIEHDRIFVHDWTIPISIGAYAHEQEPQQVRFSIEVDILRYAGRPSDLRHVVSYDLITDAISRHTVHHVDLVETLAEDVAQTILAHPRVARVEVTVEKLDLGPGALGCRIVRTPGARA